MSGSETEGPTAISEKAMVKAVMQADQLIDSLYLGDQGFGVYRTAQTARACHKKVILRLESKVAPALQKRNSAQRYLKAGEQRQVTWAPTPQNQVDPDLPTDPVAGWLIYAQISQPGFRPIDLYLFTTLLDEQAYPASACGLKLTIAISKRPSIWKNSMSSPRPCFAKSWPRVG